MLLLGVRATEWVPRTGARALGTPMTRSGILLPQSTTAEYLLLFYIIVVRNLEQAILTVKVQYIIF